MRLRTFTAHDMPAAMKQVREALGDGAIILASESHKGRQGVTVTAAVEEMDEADIIVSSPARPQDGAGSPSLQMRPSHYQSPEGTSTSPRMTDKTAMDFLRFEIQNTLRFHNVPELFIAKLMQKASDGELSSLLAIHALSATRDNRHLLRLALERLADSYFVYDPLPLDEPDARLMLIGSPGVGKTLTIAKMAARLALNKQKLAVITTDTKRAGGVEQLQAFTGILGLPLQIAASRSELSRHLQSLPPRMRVLIDTAGCNPYDATELKELEACATLEGIEPVLVMPAGSDSLEAIDIVESFMALPVKRLLVTRADTARRFGGILASAAAHGLAFSNVSRSSSITDALQPLDAALLAQLLLRYQLQT